MEGCGDTKHLGIRYLPVCDIISMNKRMLELTPDEHFGILNPSGLESAQCRPAQHSFYSQDDDVFTLAAVLGEALVQNHCFNNANKRTAAGCVYDFLALNGWELTAPEDDSVTMYLGIATKEYSMEEFSDWLYYWAREFDTSTLNN
ncbi:type II toxin-antitoxin system death-on-curing family toxin [Halomonas sp. MS1]|nr:type II toxin-antitoxin system death-on-curing family toxin [Halomonas sp. MS1]